MKFLTALLLLLCSAAQAEVIRYSYQGPAFDDFSIGMPVGPSAVAGYVDIDGGLPVSATSDFPLTGPGQAAIVGWSFTDGVNVITTGSVYQATFNFTTDALGDIVDWSIVVADVEWGMEGGAFPDPGDPVRLTLNSQWAGSIGQLVAYDVAQYLPVGQGPTVCSGLNCYEGNAIALSSSPGVWTTTVVPLPAAIWMFVSGLGMLGWYRRQRA